jgi:hypothetical protein
VREGWLAVIHGLDELEHPSRAALMRYCAGVIIQDAERLDRVDLPLAGPHLRPPGIAGGVHRSRIVEARRFPTAIDARGVRAFEMYFGMADYEIGRGRLYLDLCPENGRAICASTVKW